jgi:multidrug efflux system membrane fusion protein
VRPSERGFLVYVVEGKQAVERVIEIGLRTPDGRIEVRSGLKPGEKVVIRGADALRNGVEVNVGGATGGAKSGSPRGPAQ